uniref:Uncharacterized protein n=1 Tax=Arundo donax TaxID=35708 RepID=A0A0A9AQ00_ARUDO
MKMNSERMGDGEMTKVSRSDGLFPLHLAC